MYSIFLHLWDGLKATLQNPGPAGKNMLRRLKEMITERNFGDKPDLASTLGGMKIILIKYDLNKSNKDRINLQGNNLCLLV